MSYKKYEIINYPPTPFPSSINPFFPSPKIPSFFDDVIFPSYDVTITSFDPFYTYQVIKKTHRANSTESHLKALSDRVSSLESKLDKLISLKEKEKKVKKGVDDDKKKKKYTWTAEIKSGEKKEKWTAEIEGGKTKKYEWKSEINGKNNEGEKRVYTWKAVIGGDEKDEKEGKNEKKGKMGKKNVSLPRARIVEIEDEEEEDEVPLVVHHRDLVLRQAFAKRAAKKKGKNKELSPWDAAALIQVTFKAYLIRRSKTLRALRELAVAKNKLKELRASFHNFSYRTRISRDGEERQKFSEKVIVLLLTVDSIEGVDMMVRAAKRSMIDELEAMLDVVDPQQPGKSLSLRRRTFDMPSSEIQKEIADGVAQVVQMLDEENATFEACV